MRLVGLKISLSLARARNCEEILRPMHYYEIRPRPDRRGFDLISNIASPREAYRAIARPSARFDAVANSPACFAIANYKCVVFSERRPRPARYFAKLHEAPVGHIRPV